MSRIPASEVEYIELAEQAGADSETQGQAQVVNVIRRVSAKISGTYEGNLVFGPRLNFRPSGSALATLRRGPTTFELNFTSYSERIKGSGFENFSTASGVLVESRHYLAGSGYDEAAIGGAIKTRLGGAKVNVNGRVQWNDGFDQRTGTYSDAFGTKTGDEILLRSGPIGDLNYEIGGDIEFGVLPKLNTKIIGLYRTSTDSNDSSIEAARFGQPVTRFETRSRNKPSEAVARIQNDYSGIAAHAVQFGGEIAYNRLDARFSAASLSAGVPTNFPASDVLVEETRIEPFITDIWTVSP